MGHVMPVHVPSHAKHLHVVAQYDGKGADVWSCGVTLYVLLTGDFPFRRDEDEEFSKVLRLQREFTRCLAGDWLPISVRTLSVMSVAAVFAMHTPPPRREG